MAAFCLLAAAGCNALHSLCDDVAPCPGPPLLLPPAAELPEWCVGGEDVISPRKAGLSVLEETELKAGGRAGRGSV